jgi:xanthine dehydrogenase YagT iron-sulfur-binding subunit
MEDGRDADGGERVERSADHIGAMTRRDVIVGSAAVGGALLLPLDHDGAPAQTLPASEGGVVTRLLVNGTTHELALDPRSSLLDVLRERLALAGAKKGCDHGQCGACTVHIDGRRVASCLTMAVQAADREVTTIEGIAPADGELHPMQQAFIDHDALQCGYCTPGQIMAAIACVNEGHTRSPDEIREYMSGNLCRCGSWRPWAATCSSARAAPTFAAASRSPATSATPAAAARPLPASTAAMVGVQ